MADERVVIKIEVKSDDKDIDRTRRKLERLTNSRKKDRKAEGLASRGRRRGMVNDGRALDRVSRGYKRRFDSFDKMIKTTGVGLMKFLSLSAKGVVLDIALMGAALLSVNALFVAGRFLSKAYSGAMSMLAGAMAGAAIAIGTVAAAIREQQAAMFAFSAKGSALEFGSGLNQARVQMRTLTMDADLASVGVENLVAAFGEISKTSKFTSASKDSLKGLMDFASAGMDMKKGTEGAAAMIAVLQDTKKSYSEVISAGNKFSPQMKKALEAYEKTAGSKKTKEGLAAAIKSGVLAKLGGVDGQFEAVSGTLVNTLKAQMNLLRGLFADFGQQFLEPIKRESKEVFNIIKRAMNQMSGDIASFGNSGFIDKISDVTQKIADFMVNLTRDYLPGAIGIFQRTGDWFRGFKDDFNALVDGLRRYLDGARVVMDMFGAMWAPIKEQIDASYGAFNDMLVANSFEVERLGENIGGLIAKLMEYLQEVRKIFFEALPFINQVIKGFTNLIELFTSFLGMFMKLTGSTTNLGGIAPLMMLMGIAKGMKGTKGFFTQKGTHSGIREAANMNVNAQTIYVNGKPVANFAGSRGGGSSGPVPGSGVIDTGRSPAMAVTPGGRGAPGGPFPGVRPGGGGGGGGSGGSSGGAGLASTGAARGAFVRNPLAGGRVQAGMGPNGGDLITSGKNKGKEILHQRVRGKMVPYIYGGRGTGGVDRSQKELTGKTVRSGVQVAENDRVIGKNKHVTASGRIINRRERFARRIGEGQTHGARGFGSDGRGKSAFDRLLGRNTGARGFVGRAADRYRDRQVRNSAYLGPVGPVVPPGGTPPPGGTTPAPEPRRRFLGGGFRLTTPKAFGPGTNPNTFMGRMKDRYQRGRFYNNMASTQSNLNAPHEGRRGIGRMIQSARLNSGNVRSSRMGGMVFGNDNRKGFQGSATGTMGTMMGLGMLANSGMVSEEAKGFLSAGAMVGMMNPLAGLAIGLGGTALTAKTAGGGAVSGAAAGAAIGTMIAPGFGTAGGAIIGAAVGGIMGSINKTKDERKKAKAAFEGVFDSILMDNLGVIQQKMADQGFTGKSKIVEAAGEGGRIAKQQQSIIDKQKSMTAEAFTEYLIDNETKLGLNFDDDERKAMRKRPEESAKVSQEASKKLDAQSKITQVYSNRLKELTSLTGKSEQEIEKMAMQMGVNLYDATKDFSKVMEELGVAIVLTREQLRGASMDIALNGLKVFDEKINQLKLPETLDEQARAFGDLARAAGEGGVSQEDMSTFIRDFMPNMLNFVGGGLQGLIESRRQFGVGGSAFTQTDAQGRKGNFYGMEADFTTGESGELLQNSFTTGIIDAGKIQGTNINARLMKETGINAQSIKIDSNKFASSLAQMDPDAAMALVSSLESGSFFDNMDMENLTGEAFSAQLNKFGMTGFDAGLSFRNEKDELTMALDGMPKDLKTTYEGIIAMFGKFFDARESNKPEWMTDKFIALVNKEKDTSSPRGKGIGDTTSSRLGQTMARHSSMDGMLTGKRTMTSAYRTTGLGSINSDHVTGRAYDLVGQNLGAYQKMAIGNGGFAEFHGVNAGRHLHVVPGSGAFGDRTFPAQVSTTPAMASGGGGGISINMNVTGGDNASATEIANIAVRQMKMELENHRQRQ